VDASGVDQPVSNGPFELVHDRRLETRYATRTMARSGQDDAQPPDHRDRRQQREERDRHHGREHDQRV
jgi:hypothetical protein